MTWAAEVRSPAPNARGGKIQKRQEKKRAFARAFLDNPMAQYPQQHSL